MANELLTRDDIVRGKKNFDAQNAYMTGTADEQVTLPDGQKIKTRAGFEKEMTDKFPDKSAGFYLVGNGIGEVPVNSRSGVGLTGFGGTSALAFPSGVTKISDVTLNANFFVSGAAAALITDKPEAFDRGLFLNLSYSEGLYCQQILMPFGRSDSFCRSVVRNNVSKEIESVGDWVSAVIPGNTKPYTTTTATSANVVVTPTGELQRSTSSKIFKKDIADINIDDYRAALKAVRPVSYRSTEATADRTDWSWYSFIAEELAALDPRLVQMDNVEFFEDTDEDGNPFINSRELPEGEYAANGINTNGLVALMAHISQQMLLDIEKLEDEKTQLKRRTTNLEKRMDALENPAADNPV